MFKSLIAATAMVGLMTGVSLAQSSTTTTTQSTTSVPPPVAGVAVDSMSRRTVDADGVVTDKTKTYATGTTMAPSGDLATTRKTTETTTIH
jgi:hypothetical protein